MKFTSPYFHPIALSLKKRIFLFFSAILLVSILSYSYLTRNMIRRLMENKVAANYKTNLSQALSSVENIMWNLNLVSQQLGYDTSIQQELSSLHSLPDSLEKMKVYNALRDQVLSMTFSNQDVGLFYYYNPKTQELLFNSLPLPEVTLENTYRILTTQTDFTYYGPAVSQTRFNGNPVLILNRKITLNDDTQLYLCIESGYSSLKRIFDFNKDSSSYLLFTDSQNQIIYSDLPEENDIDFQAILSSPDMEGNTASCQWFRQTSKQGWNIYSVIPGKAYRSELNGWRNQTLLTTLIILGFATLLGMLLWRSIYKPLQLFDRQLDHLLSKEASVPPQTTNIPEYDRLLNRLFEMKSQINEMLHQTIRHEKQYAQVEMDKLRAQINPHFLMNTLNTLHWLSFMHNEPEIDSITQALTRLLSYNLDKKSRSTDLEQELLAANEYVTLQKVRYNFNYLVYKDPADAIMDYPCPKFLLQPLIENAIFHGYRENMDIKIHICVEEHIRISVTDTGAGMEEKELEMLRKLCENTSTEILHRKITQDDRLGIGLQYVIRSLKQLYPEDFQFFITSTAYEGTTITLTIPKIKGGGYLD